MSGEAQAAEGARAGLYERLVGEGWGALDEPVRRLHLRARGAGAFKVRRGGGRVARVVARLMGLPEGGEDVPLRLSVEPHGGGERWRRNFAGREFVTVQGEHAAGLMAERTGSFELLFRLKAEGGALLYRQEGVALRVGGLRVRLPRLLAPCVEAWERGDKDGGVQVSVCVTAPLVGLLIRYEGLLRTEDEERC
ncbi:MAG: DUF4166 domain-containing protein [Acidobacteria bacterium]|nr:DUF4166 domain-containing protein [Acidobacteriota bacterium]